MWTVRVDHTGYMHVNPDNVQPSGHEWAQFFSEDADGRTYFDHNLFFRWKIATAIRLEYKFNVESGE